MKNIFKNSKIKKLYLWKLEFLMDLRFKINSLKTNEEEFFWPKNLNL